MARATDHIDEQLAAWLGAQPLFFVASAPLSESGHINVSPKSGSGTLRVLGPTSVGYLDLNGSGSETIAHIRENGRVTVMFCAFAGPPRIMRLYGRGSFHLPSDPEWAELRGKFDPPAETAPLVRAIVTIEIDRVQDSCGYVVPYMQVVGERPHMQRWAAERERKDGPCWDVKYRNEKNVRSIDGLPAIPHAPIPDDE